MQVVQLLGRTAYWLWNFCDQQEEYNKYFSLEYETFRHFLECNFLLSESILNKIEIALEQSNGVIGCVHFNKDYKIGNLFDFDDDMFMLRLLHDFLYEPKVYDNES